MTALPHALRPWAESLSKFPLDAALHLGPLVARLSAALGPLRAPSEREGGEPQGYDGLSRRGAFDRLLVSEWLWALEAPDELVRRAAFGELSFLKPAFREPRRAHRTVALLDAGPDQLGAPRLAHLALLIVMARRAQAAGAPFTWGVLQADPKGGAFTDVTPATVGAWLGARDTAPPSAERLVAWREALGLDARTMDVWLVGAPRLSRLAGAESFSRIEVSEVLAPEVRQLAVDVRAVSRAPRSVVLDLPPPGDSVRLLRDPFRARVAAPVKTTQSTRVSRFAFSADGRRLLLFYSDGSVGAMALPNSPRATVARPQRVRPQRGETFLGAGWRRQGGLLVLAKKAGDYVFRGQLQHRIIYHPRAVFPWGLRDTQSHPPVPEAGQRLGRLTTYLNALNRECVLLVGLDDNLYCFEEDPATRRVVSALVARDVMTAAHVRGVNMVVTRDGQVGPGSGVRLGIVSPNEVSQVPLEDSRIGTVWFGASHHPGHSDAGLIAVNNEPGVWGLHHRKAVEVVTLPPGFRAVGVGAFPGPEGLAGLLALEPDQRSFWSMGAHHQSKLVVAAADVVHAEASHAVPVLAWLTTEGELVLYHLEHNVVLCRIQTGGGV
ncbi:hypothetical protein [Corallococcus macrosporus]|uniref:Lipoprotein LpqB beta-propeller domain-containing protein n=1 Tax=Corallococcus macrosporus DSM 14697 TaxID=1189310 RepID=A0A250K4M3_9BACT|nr:hypothetical protein [Corallococcus macrosporus]ATB51059.1 hypothetical protein MYMAC_006716 [Corallococcus macrosporus DSM 14697]